MQPNLFDISDAAERARNVAPTSIAAHERIAPLKPGIRAEILAWLRERGEFGGTLDEFAAESGKFPNALSGRFSEMKDARLIVDSGRRRQTRSGTEAIVWILNERNAQ